MKAGRGDPSLERLPTPRDATMMRINRRAQERELSRLFALREGNTSLSSVVARDVASAMLGRLAMAGVAGEKSVALRPRVGLDEIEPRRGPARPAPRSDAQVRRVRRRGVRPRQQPRAESPAEFLRLAPEVAERAGMRASDLLDLCRAFGEVLEQLEGFARALADVTPVAETSAQATDAGVAEAEASASSVGYPDGLTRREVEVLMLVAEGRTSKQIAAELCVAVPTVSRHLANIYAKIDARSRADATRYALVHLADELAAR
jgi:DNA-binding CsgD family transcriptional regulator